VGRAALAGAIAALAAGLAASPTHAQTAPKETWFSGFSSIVVDAKTGEVIDSNKADELRHPASLTKVMTLYLLFAELEAGRLKLDSKIRISTEAAAQPPSKLGLKPGETIDVEDAIKAIVTRSANDVAVAVAEIIAGDENSFARLMTQRARSLGMMRTVFRNASGLPDPDQVTTARDMALLGLAVQDRFPKYYPYFATRVFHWRGVAIGNHNRLLGSVDGVDGIKTGYTRASGFNLISSVKRGDRQIVAVVMGGKTGAARDAYMRDLITEKIRFAHAGPRTAPRFTENSSPLPKPTSAAARPAKPAVGSRDPVERTRVRVVAVRKDGSAVDEGDRPTGTLPVSTLSPASVQKAHQITPTAVAPDGKIVTFAPPPAPSEYAAASAQESPELERSAVVSSLVPETAPTPAPAAAAKTEPTENEPSTTAPRGGWIIQIGAYASETQARERLAEARARAAGTLAKVNSYTEAASRGSTKIYRARFAGFDEASAKRACETLKKNDFACFAAKN
jgi:D-alanyl-D-alanine carboxypeptidase